jgi:hypothetical protein
VRGESASRGYVAEQGQNELLFGLRNPEGGLSRKRDDDDCCVRVAFIAPGRALKVLG